MTKKPETRPARAAKSTRSRAARPAKNETEDVLRLGLHGAPDGPAHTAPLVKDAPQQGAYGPGTYGNDQFTGRAAGTTAPVGPPEGHDKPVSRRQIADKPDTQRRDDRYGRNGNSGVG
jgi:hypothetical protein